MELTHQESLEKLSESSKRLLHHYLNLVFGAIHSLIEDRKLKKGDRILFGVKKNETALHLCVNNNHSFGFDLFANLNGLFYGAAFFNVRLRDEEALPKDLLQAYKKHQISAYHLPSQYIELYFEIHCFLQYCTEYMIALINVSYDQKKDKYELDAQYKTAFRQIENRAKR